MHISLVAVLIFSQVAALNYKVIILDEVHERSVESDLVLVCVKQFLLKNNDLRVVLMSATADISRYRDYFRDLGRGERVEVLAIPSSNQHMVFQRSVSYVDQVAESLGISSEIMHSKYSSCLDLSKAVNAHKFGSCIDLFAGGCTELQGYYS
ncbi:unnamed protein product [Lathyrus sativus]|nr:unnamed protein product [Lathyrus sativus]